MDIKRLFELSGVTLTESRYQELRAKLNEDDTDSLESLLESISEKLNEALTKCSDLSVFFSSDEFESDEFFSPIDIEIEQVDYIKQEITDAINAIDKLAARSL